MSLIIGKKEYIYVNESIDFCGLRPRRSCAHKPPACAPAKYAGSDIVCWWFMIWFELRKL